jgi:hypothetical protein
MALTKVTNDMLSGYPFSSGGGSSTNVVASRTLLKALDTTTVTCVSLAETGREGVFIFKTGNYAAKVTADTSEGLFIKANAIATTVGAWVRVYDGPASVKWFGAVGDGVTNDIVALQAATDNSLGVWIPSGIYKILSTWLLRDYNNLFFESHQAVIQGDLATPLISTKNSTTDRRYFIGLHGGRIDAVDKSGGSVGIDFAAVTYGHVWGTWVYNCAVGIRSGGGGQSAYYNNFVSFVVSTCSVGIQNGTLGNSNTFQNGSVKDCLVCAEDDNNSDTTYNMVAFEGFTLFGVRIANSAVATTFTRILNCRFENPSTTGLYASAVAIRVNPLSINARIRDNYISVVTTGISDSGVTTQSSGN